MIRFICLNIFIAIYSFFIFLSAVLLSFFDQGGRRVRFYLGVPWAKVILWVCGIHVRVTGQEHVNPDVPTVFMCNHQSYFDIYFGKPIPVKGYGEDNLSELIERVRASILNHI